LVRPCTVPIRKNKPESLSAQLDVSDLSESSLVDLAAQLAVDLRHIEAEVHQLEQLMVGDRGRLLKPGTKLTLNAACAIVGIALAPVTLGLSLGATLVSAAVTAWDGIDYARDVAKAIDVRLQARKLRTQVREIDRQLAEIAKHLTIRQERHRRRSET
jgi:hypothetical protein